MNKKKRNALLFGSVFLAALPPSLPTTPLIGAIPAPSPPLDQWLPAHPRVRQWHPVPPPPRAPPGPPRHARLEVAQSPRQLPPRPLARHHRALPDKADQGLRVCHCKRNAMRTTSGATSPALVSPGFPNLALQRSRPQQPIRKPARLDRVLQLRLPRTEQRTDRR